MAAASIDSVVQELESFTGHGAHVLSVYLLTDPTTAPGSNLHAQVSDLLRPLSERIDPAAAPGEQFRREQEAVERYLEDLGTPPRGLALFSCVERGFFRALRLPVRVGPNAYWGTAPYLRPLLSALDEFERTIVVLLDKERARFFRIFLQQIEEIADLIETTPGKHRQYGGAWAYPPGPDWTRGGWSDSGIARHEETHVLWHAKQVVETLARLVSRERVDRVLVGGTPEVLAEFRRLVPRSLRARIAAETVHVPLFARPSEVLASVQAATERAERAAEERLVDDLVEALGAGRAVAGPAAVLDAVLGGQVYLLVVGEATRLHGYLCERCGHLTLPPAPRECPLCEGAMHRIADLAEHLTQRVLAQGGRVEEVRGTAAERLATHGAIAAFLRYTLPVEPSAARTEA